MILVYPVEIRQSRLRRPMGDGFAGYAYAFTEIVAGYAPMLVFTDLLLAGPAHR